MKTVRNWRRFIATPLSLGAFVGWLSCRVLPDDGGNEPPVLVDADSISIRADSLAAQVHQLAAARELFLRRIDESGTYLPVMIAEADSMLRRWPERRERPLRVFLEPTTVAGHTPQKSRAVRDAFRRWQRVPEIPVDFVYTRKAEDADVVVRWIESFGLERAGQAEVMWQTNGLLRSGTLTLATHATSGFLLSTDAVFTVALHEIGHLLGLGHSDDPRDVMYPTTGVHDLTMRDRRTAMLLYSLPPGTLAAQH